MQLGIGGRKAIVSGASKGLGRSCAFSLAREGVHLTIVARGEATLKATGDEIYRETGIRPTTVAVDIISDEGQEKVREACPDPDILVTNVTGPTPGEFRNWGRAEWTSAFNANMLTPILLIRRFLDGMIQRQFGRIVNITSHSVKMPLPHLGLSSGARAGLTGLVAALSREVVRHGITINNLLPGQFATDRWKANMQRQADAAGVALEEIVRQRLEANPAGRLGEPSEFGDACAFLCAAQSGYITGQNIVIDGGQYPGII